MKEYAIKTIKVMGIIFFAMITFGWGKSNIAEERKVYIPSDELRKSVVKSIEENTGKKITDELPTIKEMEYADSVYLAGESLEGVQYLTNVESAVYVPVNEGSIDMRPIGKMKNLKFLQYYWYMTEAKATHMVQDISYLSGLENLEGLDLYGYPVLDLTPLSNLKNLDRFDGDSYVTAPTAVVDRSTKQLVFENPMKYSTQFDQAEKSTGYTELSNEDDTWNKKIDAKLENNLVTVEGIDERATQINVTLTAISSNRMYRHNLQYTIPLVWK
ncbi:MULTISPECIES: hypothetical protein [unclassified Enterococcus]|uniref:hypothetical protein n=1 Tax=unclassified Enterococcus TaxID=2608891 RepID=UPI001CE09783|nr:MULTISPECIES: hypothetical protein [unclassified Enterococcus]MCA5011543.1 hypothetical protein [Enterococcus sp. S23]MCA5015015.1 hypothetical protein [Enterococcus sp. S22(2020)]